jgi:AAA domain, putative AbiEii toxin, Type IV TA system
MRIVELQTPLLKGAQARLEWQPLSVLFGANSAGKTNLLEAVGQALGRTPKRVDPLIDWDVPEDAAEWWVVVELDESKPGDRALLCEALQYGELLWTIGAETPNHRSARRRANLWDDSAREGDESFGPLGLDALRDFRRNEARAVLRHQHQVDWELVADDVETVVDALASAHHLIVRSYPCHVAVSLHDERLVSAMTRLLEARDQWNGWVPYIGAGVGKQRFGGFRPCFDIEDRDPEMMDGLPLWDVTAFSTELDRTAVLDAVEAAVDEAFKRGRWQEQLTNGYFVRSPETSSGGSHMSQPHRQEEYLLGQVASEEEIQERVRPRYRVDPWLQQSPEGTMLHPGLRLLCGEVGATATELAPPFVKERLAIELTALEPGQWRPNQGRRVRLAIRERGTNREHDLIVAGSGIALWSSLAVLEAIRSLQRPPHKRQWPEEEDVVHAPETGEEEEYFIAQADKIRVYLIDEPERHLHPIAQRQAATWIANLAQLPGAPSVVVATHSPAFLNLPSETAQYIAIARRDQETLAEVIDPEDILRLDSLARDLGIERSDLLQLVRRVLIVEGEHDKLVLERFFGRELAEARTRIVPIRGTKNTAGIVESETLAALGVPLVILFDDVHAAFIQGDREAETTEEKHLESVREMWRNRKSDQDLRLIPFPLPDIFAALPEEAVRAAVAKRRGKLPEGGMESVYLRYRAADATNYKAFLAEQCAVSSKPEKLAALLLAILDEAHGANPHPFLHDAVQRAIGHHMPVD